ncbi:ATP-binding protein [Sphingomonas aracearum]|uniref:histidine kinase n=1 Tax=Sphingomonas aracearum TaxID=2283317 RepID=A0A369VYE2_9SPHN|nr:ATP-binding protein [Sphingomonas aracearum]RDE06645.1 response regulator [Sphingomonas aracearum]
MSGNEGAPDALGAAPGGPDARWRTTALVALAVLAAAVLVALVVTLASASRQRDRALTAQTHSFGVMILARSLSGTIARSEASLGRYVVSGDKALGRRYSDQWTLADTQLTQLARVTGDNPEQQALLADLRRAYEQRGAELATVALSTSYRKNQQAYARFYKAGRSPSLDAIDKGLQRIIDSERELLSARSTVAARTVARANALAKVLAVFGSLLVVGAVALGWLTTRAIGERAHAEHEAALERERAAELEAAVARATAELREQEAKLRQVQKMDAVGQLTGGIAHDFNNMLAVVLGGLELSRRQLHSDPAGAARHLDSATEGANRAAALTRRLLAFSREEPLKLEPIAPGALISGMRDLLDRTLGDTITVSTPDSSDGWQLCADRHQLENAILNLAVNARDAMDGRGALEVATGRRALAAGEIGSCAAGDYVTVAVTDTGCGMAPDVLERVFEPFFTTKPAGKGTGLGLSQAFAFVRQAQGELAIRSAPGAGTTVTLYLPRFVAAPRVEAVPAVPVAAAPPLSALDVLVVEDDPRVLAATLGALEELGHRAHGCDDPLKAPALLADLPQVELIVSDVLMPGQTGPEMVAGLRDTHGHVAVLFVTGFAGEAGGEAEFGGHHVLRKPYTLAGLERAIGQALAADRPAPPHSIAAE